MHCWRTTPILITYKEGRLSRSHLLLRTPNFSDPEQPQNSWSNNEDGTAQVDSPLVMHSKRDTGKAREEHNEAILEQLRAKKSPGQLKANDLATPKKGASSWLTILLLKLENYSPNNRDFYDSLSLRYPWTPKYLPSVWPGGKRFDVDYAMSCMKGGLSIGSMTKCKIRSHRCSRMYVMMSSRTTRADPKRRKSK